MREVRRTLLESAFVGGVGLVLGLSANAMNPDGLVLSKNYFKRPVVNGTQTTRPGQNGLAATEPGSGNEHRDTGNRLKANGQNGSSAGETPTENAVVDYLQGYGLQPITYEETVALFQDSSHHEGICVFIDARDDEQYAEGHVPAAYQLDHYRTERYPERYIETLLEACAGAVNIVVYCNGGKCEDSVFTAGDLFDHGVDPNRVFVYVGGFETWAAGNMPIEKGQRLSGQVNGGQQ